MLSKTMIAFAAAAIVTSASAALAYEDPENKIGDRYPFLEQRYTPSSARVSSSGYMISGDRLAQRSSTRARPVDLSLYSYEDPENRIGDRYPFLERIVAPQRGLGSYATAGRTHKQTMRQKV